MNTKTEALSTRIRFRLKTQLFLSVFKNNPRSPREQENGVFQKFHFVDRVRKVPLLFHRLCVDERPIREKKVACFQKNPDTCGCKHTLLNRSDHYLTSSHHVTATATQEDIVTKTLFSRKILGFRKYKCHF